MKRLRRALTAADSLAGTWMLSTLHVRAPDEVDARRIGAAEGILRGEVAA